MEYAIMGTTYDDLKKTVFDAASVRDIIRSETALLSFSYDGSRHFLTHNDLVYEIVGYGGGSRKDGYYIVLSSSQAVKVRDYKILKTARALPGNFVLATDEEGREHWCIRFSAGEQRSPNEPEASTPLNLNHSVQSLQRGNQTV